VTTAIVQFNRDLRIHDHPALRAATVSADRVVPLFVFDDGILRGPFASPNRIRLLVESVHDLRAELEDRGATLFVRRGDPAHEVMRIAAATSATEVHVSRDHSRYAVLRQDRLRGLCVEARLALGLHPGVAVIEPGAILPSGGGDHVRVFTPYWRRWAAADRRRLLAAPRRVRVPTEVSPGRIPSPAALGARQALSNLRPGGELAARARLSRWLAGGLSAYADLHDALADDQTSHMSADVHFGSLSPLEVVTRAESKGGPGADAFVRQMCWRDFHLQVLAARPDLPTEDYRSGRQGIWRDDPSALEAWRTGTTGVPIVDAGMRQLRREGFMHNRARLIAASFLTKDLLIDWRAGAAHFWRHLVDGDIANNAGNWQWVAGTGNDPRPNRLLNPIRQARRFDPDGAYVRRHVPELRGVRGPAVHEPWTMDATARAALDYPPPIADHRDALERLRAGRRVT
jgi:deoxyribodipyrimidine photo-lyase